MTVRTRDSGPKCYIYLISLRNIVLYLDLPGICPRVSPLKLFNKEQISTIKAHSLENRATHIVVGITSPQTCLVLGGRLRALREAGFRVTLVASPGDRLDRTGESEGIDTFDVPMARSVAPFSDVLSFFRLWYLLIRLRPDVVEFSTPKAGLLGMLAAVLSGVRHRVYLLRGLRLESATGFKRKLLLRVERMAAACAHVVVCVSPSLHTMSLALGLAPPAKLQMLGSGSSKGVDTEHFRPGRNDKRRRFGVPGDAKVIGFVGRFTRDKGIPALIEAFERVLQVMPKSYLLMVGWFDDGDDALDLNIRNRIAMHSHIVCTGFVEDTAPYYRAMDLLILPTMREGFPNAVLEASATGIPVITTRTTGACDSVVDSVTGLIVPGNPESICEATVNLLQDPQKSKRMGSAGRAWVLQHFTDQRIFSLTTSFYKSLLRPSVVAVSGEEPAMDLAMRLR